MFASLPFGTLILNSFAALRPRMLRLSCSVRNGRLAIELGGSKSQCGQSDEKRSWLSALIASNVASVSFEVARLDRLRRVEHLAHVFARPALEQRRFRAAHQIFAVEPLHQERHPGEAALDPDHLQLGEALRQAVEHPVGHVHHVEMHERDRVHADEAVDRAIDGSPQLIAGMERERLAGLLQRA